MLSVAVGAGLAALDPALAQPRARKNIRKRIGLSGVVVRI